MMNRGRWPIVAVGLGVAASTVLAGCTNRYNHRFDKYDKYDMGKLSLSTEPTGAQVWAKALYKIDMSMSSFGRQQMHAATSPGSNITHPMQDWTLIGTTPLRDFQILVSGKATDRDLQSTGRMDVTLMQLSLRIEKEGYETRNIENVLLRPEGTELTLTLKPAKAVASPETLPQ